jgi:hypothetical protein
MAWREGSSFKAWTSLTLATPPSVRAGTYLLAVPPSMWRGSIPGTSRMACRSLQSRARVTTFSETPGMGWLKSRVIASLAVRRPGVACRRPSRRHVSSGLGVDLENEPAAGLAIARAAATTPAVALAMVVAVFMNCLSSWVCTARATRSRRAG